MTEGIIALGRLAFSAWLLYLAFFYCDGSWRIGLVIWAILMSTCGFDIRYTRSQKRGPDAS